jgi:hypothetical protein
VWLLCIDTFLLQVIIDLLDNTNFVLRISYCKFFYDFLVGNKIDYLFFYPKNDFVFTIHSLPVSFCLFDFSKFIFTIYPFPIFVFPIWCCQLRFTICHFSISFFQFDVAKFILPFTLYPIHFANPVFPYSFYP